MTRSVRLASAATVLAVALTLLALVAMQLVNIVARNVAMSRDVAAAHADVASLRSRRAEDLRTIARLADPLGAVPEIHDRLKLVGPREELIYVRAPAASDADPR